MGDIILVAIAWDKKFKKIMLPMLKLYTNYGFHELFLNHELFLKYSVHLVNYNVLWTEQNLEPNSVIGISVDVQVRQLCVI